MGTKTIFRVAYRERPYSQLGNAMLRDKRISLEAAGALGFILSHPPNWRFSLQWLCRERGIGRDKAQRLVRELIENGYCVKGRDRDEKGRLGPVEYLFSDEPDAIAPQPENPVVETQHLVGPQPEKPALGKPAPVNPPPTKKVRSKKGKTPPTPPKGAEGESFDLDQVVFRLRSNVEVRSKAKEVAPGWCVDWLITEWAKWQSSLDEAPRSVAKSFIAFCERKGPHRNAKFGSKPTASAKRPKTSNAAAKPKGITIGRFSASWGAWQDHADKLDKAKGRQMARAGFVFVPTEWPNEASPLPNVPEKQTKART